MSSSPVCSHPAKRLELVPLRVATSKVYSINFWLCDSPSLEQPPFHSRDPQDCKLTQVWESIDSVGGRFSDPELIEVRIFCSLIPKMFMFSLAISCLTTSNLPWFTDLTFQVPTQMQYCSLQHQTLLSPPDTSTTEGLFGLTPSVLDGPAQHGS